MNYRNNPELFPELCLSILKTYAKQLAEDLAETGIEPERISLYRGSNSKLRHKYVLAVFVPKGWADSERVSVFRFQHLLSAPTNYQKRTSWQKQFAEFYRNPPEGGACLKGWMYLPVSEENELESLVQTERCWVLWAPYMEMKSMPSKCDTNWNRIKHKVAEIAKDHPDGITKEDAYRNELVKRLMHAIWRKKIPSLSTLARNVTNVLGLKTGRPRKK
jgi:hypothetical protein